MVLGQVQGKVSVPSKMRTDSEKVSEMLDLCVPFSPFDVQPWSPQISAARLVMVQSADCHNALLCQLDFLQTMRRSVSNVNRAEDSNSKAASTHCLNNKVFCICLSLKSVPASYGLAKRGFLMEA